MMLPLDHPCYPHRSTCDHCPICRGGDCCDGEGNGELVPQEEQPVSIPVGV